MKDMLGKVICEGDIVAKAESQSSSAYLTIRVVKKIVDGRMYLDDSKVQVKYPNRLLILEDGAMYLPHRGFPYNTINPYLLDTRYKDSYVCVQ